ncbi:MAG: XRE family transcriptional regulator [Planctomycetota bacterium]
MPVYDKIAISKRLNELMVANGWNQTDAAGEFDMGQGMISGILRGTRMPGRRFLEAFEDRGFSPRWLMYGEGNPILQESATETTLRESKPYICGAITAQVNCMEAAHGADNFIDWIELDEKNAEKLHLTGIRYMRARGTSMEPLVRDGQILIVRDQAGNVEDGDLVIAQLRNGNKIFKRLQDGLAEREGRVIVLSSVNPNDRSFSFKRKDIMTMWKVLGVIFDTK